VLMEERKTLAEILVIFTSDEILSDLKKEFFNKEHLTDVISFRMNNYNDDKVEGEIYISIPQVERNARKFDQSISRELARIIIHGSLHLLNYEDSTLDSKNAMTEKENYFLKKTNWKNLV
jgi:probable rRNA maturation factor